MMFPLRTGTVKCLMQKFYILSWIEEKGLQLFFLEVRYPDLHNYMNVLKKKRLKAAFLDRRLDVFTMHSTKGITHSDPNPKLHNLPLVLQRVLTYLKSLFWFHSGQRQCCGSIALL